MRWLLLSLALLFGNTYSEEPAPAPAKRSDSPKEKAATGYKPATKSEFDSEARPLVVKIIDAPQGKSDSTKDKPEEQHNPTLYHFFGRGFTAEAWTAWFTLALAVIGFITAGILICQSYFLRRSVNLARDEFLASNPPKIRVKHVWPNGELWGKSELVIHTQITNIGGTPATITGYFVKTKTEMKGAPLPQPPDYGNKILVQARLERGISYDLDPITRRIETDKDHSRIRNGEDILYCFGFIEYEDIEKRLRTTAFIRRLEPPDSRLPGSFSKIGNFVRLDKVNTDYEYED